ncbi:hypothetical protein DNC_02615 [Chlamydia muridarum]|nr:hypothetical protein [Chlamydia muridarum]AID38038.1 hypothetical protein BB17_02775 [Chlamydia muridarum str. Nigg 2 MCR]AIT91098.1 hypothetical protein NC80_02595 [Chlamydia muridarum]AIT91990.1 hypothetical protein NC81_02610 [Chlamydia muridarum]AIW23866.1 hypothetical protein DNC_02615 [Chlamydia muridarum]AJR10591.1 hypothetical protein BD36_02780 [Chlamydia muridarum]
MLHKTIFQHYPEKRIGSFFLSKIYFLCSECFTDGFLAFFFCCVLTNKKIQFSLKIFGERFIVNFFNSFFGVLPQGVPGVGEFSGVSGENRQSSEVREEQDRELENKLLAIRKRTDFFPRQQDISLGTQSLRRTRMFPCSEEELKDIQDLFSSLESFRHQLAQLFFYTPPLNLGWEDFLKFFIAFEKRELGGILFSAGPFESFDKYLYQVNRARTVPVLIATTVSYALQAYCSYTKRAPFQEKEDFFQLGEAVGTFLKERKVSITLIYKEILDLDARKYSELCRGLQQSQIVQGEVFHSSVREEREGLNPISVNYDLLGTIAALSANIDRSYLRFSGSHIFHNDEIAIEILHKGGDVFTFSSLEEFQFSKKRLLHLVAKGKVSPEIIRKKLIKVLLLKKRAFKSPLL